MTAGFDVSRIIEERSFLAEFQVVVSYHKELPKGIEAFVKGIDPDTGKRIHPRSLFLAAELEGRLKDLNEAMIEVAARGFKKIYRHEKDMLFFINVHGSLVKAGGKSVAALERIVKDLGIPTEAVAFDITEYDDISVEEVHRFIRVSRSKGFYISIDDIGKGYANVDRILLYNPDIIKINVQYIEKLPYQDYRERLIKRLCYIAQDMGILMVITGVEEESVLKEAFDLGVQYFQGYYLSKPMAIKQNNWADFADFTRFDEIFVDYIGEIHVDESRAIMNRLVVILNRIKERSCNWDVGQQEQAFEYLFYKYPFIQNAWVVDEDGIQVTKGRINKEGFRRRNSGLFKVYDQGHDFSNEEFYTILSMGALDVWITKPYTSLINNQLCMATSSFIKPVGGERQNYILCLEVNLEVFGKTHLETLQEVE